MTRDWRWPAILVGAVLLAYANSFHGVFQFDDYSVIVNAAQVHSWEAWGEGLGHGLRPLLKLTYLANWLAGPGEWGFHLVNLAIHLVNAALVFFLVKAFGARCGNEMDWSRIGFVAALLFALHPVHTEAVTYISGRSSALMTTFYLAALLSYARGSEGGGKGLRFLSLGLFGAAVLVKESALMFPFALWAWEWALGAPWRTVAARQWPHWLLCGAAALALALNPGYGALLWDSVHTRGLYDALMVQLAGAADLGFKLIWPTGLNIDPEVPAVGGAVAGLYLAGLAVLFVLARRARAARPWLSLGLVWFLVHLLVLNTFLPRFDGVNERQLYWADWGLFMALAVELTFVDTLVQRLGVPLSRVRESVGREGSPRAHTASGIPWSAIAATAAACALAFATMARNEVYRSEVALWQDAVAKAPGNARAHNNLGYAYSLAGRAGEAKQAYRQALRLDPGHLKATNNLAALRGNGP